MAEDWRFSDDRMQLRAAVFRALSHYLEDHCREVYEFCHDWVSQGNKDVTNIDEKFHDYLEQNKYEKYVFLERCFDGDPSKFYNYPDT